MIYDFVTPNIIRCNNFLPQFTKDLIWEDLWANKDNFGIPQWRKSNVQGQNEAENHTHLCGGKDWWDKEAPNINKLPDWVLHQGLMSWIEEKQPKSVFHFLPKFEWLWSVHAICYNRAGYYNWHQDHVTLLNGKTWCNNIFTASVVLQQPSPLEGGEALFMDGGIHVEPPKDNVMYLFPSYIPHAVKTLRSEEDVAFDQQRFSIQLWLGFDNLEGGSSSPRSGLKGPHLETTVIEGGERYL